MRTELSRFNRVVDRFVGYFRRSQLFSSFRVTLTRKGTERITETKRQTLIDRVDSLPRVYMLKVNKLIYLSFT